MNKHERAAKFDINMKWIWYFVTKIVLNYCEKKMFYIAKFEIRA